MTTTRYDRPLTMPFGPIEVHYDERVLTPRPWTLLQSRWAAELALRAAGGPIIELCAGAGQIGLAAAVLSGRRLVQVDADPVACHYAMANAALAGRARDIEVRQAQVDSAIRDGEQFPIILADPPYLPTAAVPSWPDDPPSAIDGGADGLDLVSSCLAAADTHLLPGGYLLLQVAGEVQAQAVCALLESTQRYDLTPLATRHHDRHRAVMLLRPGRSRSGG